ncbi:MAG: hypothetical protein ABI867_25180 [Kofleriaceae bacterium]
MRIVTLTGVLLLALAGIGEAAPAVRVTLNSNAIGAVERSGHVDRIRTALADAVAAAPADAKHLDVAVTRLSYATVGDEVEVCVELKVIVSTAGDEMRSFASGNARLTVARHGFRVDQLPALRRAVMHDALDALRRRIRSLRPAKSVS